MAGRYKKGWSADHQKTFVLYTQGMLPSDIAKKVGCGIDKIRNIIRSVRFQEMHTSVEKHSIDRAKKAFDDKLSDAAHKIIRIMQSGKPHERLQFDAAKEILYQCGMKPVEVIETRGKEYTPEEIQSSLEVVREIQEIEEKLSSQGSKFLLGEHSSDVLSDVLEEPKKHVKDKGSVETPTTAPVTTDVPVINVDIPVPNMSTETVPV